MKLAELQSTIADVLAAGQIGTPVSLRLHLQVVSSHIDSCGLLASPMPLAERVFGKSPERLMARQNSAADQLSVLFEYAGGQTCFVTCGSGCATRDSLQMLLFGNRGQVRLEGGELFDAATIPDEAATKEWRSRIDASLAACAPVAIG